MRGEYIMRVEQEGQDRRPALKGLVRKVRAGTLWLAIVGVTASSTLLAEDWPDFRGKDRLGVWNDTGLVESFPVEGLPVAWRVPLNTGFSSPTILNKRVFVMDYIEQQRLRGTERLLALDEATGKILWTREWPADYAAAHISLHEGGGPAAPPVADGDRVYALGRTGILQAVNANTGDILWAKDFLKDYSADFGGA